MGKLHKAITLVLSTIGLILGVWFSHRLALWLD
jgi:hypothetical protein